MARILAEGAGSQTIETDDGRIIVVPAGLVSVGGPAAPPPSELPQGVLDLLQPPEPPLPVQFAPGEIPSSAPAPAAAQPPAAAVGLGALPPAGAGLPGPPPAPGPGPAPGLAVAPGGPLPSIAATTQEGLAGMQQQQQAAESAADIESRELAATGEALRVGQERRTAVADEAAEARAKDLADLERRTKEIDAAVTEEANRPPIDPDRRFKSRTLGQRLAISIGAMLAGLGQGLMGQGGPNPVIAQIQKETEDDIRAQMADRDERTRRIGIMGGQLDRYRTVAGDRVASFNARMAEEMERQAREVEQIAATHGSEKARNNAVSIAGQFRARKAEYIAAAGNAQFTRDLSERKQTEDERHQRKQEALQGWSIAENKRQADQRLAYDYQGLLLDASKLEQAGRIEEAKAARAAAERRFELEIPNTRTKSGAPVLARTKEESTKLREQRASTESGARAIDEIVNILQTEGPPSNILQSPEWQRIRSNEGALIAAINSAMLGGVVREGDIQFIRKTFQGGDLSGIEAMIRDGLGNNAAQGLLKTRQNLEAGFSEKIRGQDPDAEPYKIPPLTGLAPKATTRAGQQFKTAVAAQTPEEIRKGGERSFAGQLLADWPGGLFGRSASELIFGSSKGPESAARIAEAEAGLTLPTVAKGQEAELLALGRRAAGGDEDSRQALLALASSPRKGFAEGAMHAAAEAGDVVLVDQISAAAPKGEIQDFSRKRARLNAAGGQVARVTELAKGGDQEAQAALVSLAMGADPDLKREAQRALVELAGKARR